jgi:hypothetical protein
MSSLLAALMLLVAVTGKSWTVPTLPVEKDKTEQPSKKAADKSAIVSELSLHAVVTPAVSFDFEKSLFVLSHVSLYSFREIVKVSSAYQTPFYYFSYFRKVFGHLIAPNAP